MNKISPRGRRDEYARRRWQFDGGKKSRRIYVRPRTGLLRTSLVAGVAKLQAASMPTA